MTTLDALARPDGTLLMVAMDQRESLRTMLAARHGDGAVDRDRLVRFKLDVARILGPHASGFLIDRELGFGAVVRERLLPRSCGLILAADALEQERGGPVEDTGVDEAVDPHAAAEAGAVALKLLVIWRDDERRAARLELSRRFVDLAASAGLLSVLEGIVRGPEGFDRDAAIVEAARELSSVGPSLYKVEVPSHGRGDADELVRRCAAIDEVVPVPWVVLSNGVEPEDFPRAVECACRGGASGILAGRALWTSVLGADDPAPLLESESLPRLQALGETVSRLGRPWRQSA